MLKIRSAEGELLGWSEGYGLDRLHTGALVVVTPDLALAQKPCVEHVGGRSLLDIFRGAELFLGNESPKGDRADLILGDFMLLRTGEPSLKRAAFLVLPTEHTGVPRLSFSITKAKELFTDLFPGA